MRRAHLIFALQNAKEGSTQRRGGSLALEGSHQHTAHLMKNIKVVVIGDHEVGSAAVYAELLNSRPNHQMEAWYFSPYPEEFAVSGKLYLCEFCLQYLKSERQLQRHKVSLLANRNPTVGHGVRVAGKV